MILNKQRYIAFGKKNIVLLFSFFNLSFIQVSNALIQILLFPVIIRLIGMEKFGYVAVANAYAALLGLFINYGTSLSGIKDVALRKSDPAALATLFFSVYHTRFALFLLSFVVPLVLHFFSYGNIHYFLFATTIILAEVVNPLFFFNGIEKLLVFNIANLLAKLTSIVLILLFIKGSGNAWWVNFYLGTGSVVLYSALTWYAIKRYRLQWQGFSFKAVWQLVKENSYLVCNNLSVQLQQSFFLFALSATRNPLILGAYSLCDKIVWSFRLLIISFSSAVYPKATLSYQAKKEKWIYYKRKINRILALIFMLVAFALYLLAPLIVLLLTGKHNQLAETYVRSVCIVPLIAALNCLNVIDLLMKNRYRYIFFIALALLGITVIVSLIFLKLNYPQLFGYYPVIVEICSLPLYLYFIRRSNTQ